MLQIIKAMFKAAVNRVAVSIVATAANKIEAAAAIEKAEVDAELEFEAVKLEAQGMLKQAQALRLRAAGIQTDAPAATALPALANLIGEASNQTTTKADTLRLVAAPSTPSHTTAPATTKRGPGRPPKANDTKTNETNENETL